jgi:Fe-S cluster assembly ATP-binding protein
MLKISNLTVKSKEKIILRNISFEMQPGQKFVIMGPNGSGKSSLAQTLAGNPDYEIDIGSIVWQKKDKKIDILKLSPEERAWQKIFVSFQNPPAIEGLKLATLLKEISLQNAKNQNLEKPKTSEILKNIKKNLKLAGLKEDFYSRDFNKDFSGGEKKKTEILQLLMLNPDMMILDEVDSGLDVDAVKNIFKQINTIFNPDKYLILITHNPKTLDLIKFDKVLILKNGEIKKIVDPDSEIIKEIFDYGFDKF